MFINLFVPKSVISIFPDTTRPREVIFLISIAPPKSALAITLPSTPTLEEPGFHTTIGFTNQRGALFHLKKKKRVTVVEGRNSIHMEFIQ